MHDQDFNRLALSGRTALITGGASGIGRATALLMAKRGADIVVLDADTDGLSDLEAEFSDGQSKLIARAGDVTREADIARAFDAAADRDMVIDILVNNAGTGARMPATELDTDTWSRVVDVNLTAAFVLSREFAKRLDRPGAIINVASIMGVVGNQLYPNASYHASKGGLVNLTRALAAEWASKSIRVNAVLPTFAATGLTTALLSSNSLREEILAKTPLGCLAEADDIAEAIAFLASDAARMITGTALPVDGGWTAV